MAQSRRHSPDFLALRWLVEEIDKTGKNSFGCLNRSDRKYHMPSVYRARLQQQGYVDVRADRKDLLYDLLVTVTPSGLEAIKQWRMVNTEEHITRLQVHAAATYRQIEEGWKHLVTLKSRA